MVPAPRDTTSECLKKERELLWEIEEGKEGGKRGEIERERERVPLTDRTAPSLAVESLSLASISRKPGGSRPLLGRQTKRRSGLGAENYAPGDGREKERERKRVRGHGALFWAAAVAAEWGGRAMECFDSSTKRHPRARHEQRECFYSRPLIAGARTGAGAEGGCGKKRARERETERE